MRRPCARAEAHIVADRRARWPPVTADVGVNWHDPTLAGTDVIAGVGFEVPVLNLRAGIVLRARATKVLAEATRDLDLVRLSSDLREAHARMVASSLRGRVMRTEVVPAMEAARRMTEEGYQEGRTDFVRVLDAQRALIESRLAWVEAAAAAARALVDVEQAAGVSLVADGRPRPDHVP